MKKKNLLRIAIFITSCVIFIFSMNGLRAQTDLKVADPDGGGDGVSCWDTITTKEASQVRFCGTCDFVDNSTSSFWADLDNC